MGLFTKKTHTQIIRGYGKKPVLVHSDQHQRERQQQKQQQKAMIKEYLTQKKEQEQNRRLKQLKIQEQELRLRERQVRLHKKQRRLHKQQGGIGLVGTDMLMGKKPASSKPQTSFKQQYVIRNGKAYPVAKKKTKKKKEGNFNMSDWGMPNWSDLMK